MLWHITLYIENKIINLITVFKNNYDHYDITYGFSDGIIYHW